MKRFLAACTILFAALFDFLSRQGDEYMIKKSAKKKNLHKAVIGVFFFRNVFIGIFCFKWRCALQ